MNGYLCGKCNLDVEREYRIFKKIKPLRCSTPMKRKDITPVKTPRIFKKAKSSFMSPVGRANISSPRTKSPRKALFSPNSSIRKRKGSLDAIAGSLTNSKYYAAFQHILSRGPAAQRAFDCLVRKRVRVQMQLYAKSNDTDFPRNDTTASISNFDWDALLSDLNTKMPTLSASLFGAMPLTTEKNRYLLSNLKLRPILRLMPLLYG